MKYWEMAADDVAVAVAAEVAEGGSLSLDVVGVGADDTVVAVVEGMQRQMGRGRSHTSDMDFGSACSQIVDLC